MGFAGTGWPQSDDILPVLDPVTAGQFQYHHFVQGWDGLKIEAVQAFDGREFGRLDPAFHPF